MDTKQVIVIRKDLKMRRGKECSQVAHSSIAFLTRKLIRAEEYEDGEDDFWYRLRISEAAHLWLQSSFKKVCLQVGSEAELMEIKAKAEAAKLEVHLVIDSGLTEFHGIPTPTCLAVGPDYSEKIDAVTGNLKLY